MDAGNIILATLVVGQFVLEDPKLQLVAAGITIYLVLLILTTNLQK